MPILTVQNTDLTATSQIQQAGNQGVKGEPLTHRELDKNFRSMWPIGSIYINVDSSKNPRDLIGFGVWKSLGKQTILVGKNNVHAHQTVTLSVGDGSGFHLGEIVTGSTSGAKARIHRFILTNVFVVEPLIDGTAFQGSETITGEDSGASTTINGGGVGGSLTSTNQNLSKKIASATVFKNISANECRIDITTNDAHQFTKGQRVTLSGITGNTGTVNPNSEREIISVASSTQFSVDYRSPSGGNQFGFGRDEALGTSSASATLFGTRYDEGIPSKAEPIPFGGTGGRNTAKLGPNEFPPHTHTVDWTFNTGIFHSSITGGRDGSIAHLVGDGSGSGFRDAQWGFVDPDNLGRYSDTGVTDSAKLAARGYKEGQSYNDREYETAREGHFNLMPFIGAYFWVRIPDSPNYEANGGI